MLIGHKHHLSLTRLTKSDTPYRSTVLQQPPGLAGSIQPAELQPLGRCSSPALPHHPAHTAPTPLPPSVLQPALQGHRGWKQPSWQSSLTHYLHSRAVAHQTHRRHSRPRRVTFWSNSTLARRCFFTSGRQRVTLSPCSLLMRSPI